MAEKNPAAVALGRLGGLVRSDKKKAACRANGKKGGRPKKNPHAVALGRRGGQVSSPKKAAASRRNGRLGGRPPAKKS